MKYTFDKLQKLESKINSSYYKSKNKDTFFETKIGSQLEQK
jgi:hypothetical protein